ncbi:hypothetical protein CEUSTIGMA_g2369.t1 [Chlamydomonas eustigma]|uniref:N-acetyltransferase domain-containing protein n=1 Tax=Chlamydomonas eustigma TaxID=1157962 RepID=A0A250WVQ0_9CHLO|nr:hypothetical protein CEUSTIGMA_g2369.t1 [Chlamydomonas eustigma]|eukprot:GAX74923.1 hypothetical protein CEUSTIGMA_g2369.t1 [Chlamydomonas eustigma]
MAKNNDNQWKRQGLCHKRILINDIPEAPMQRRHGRALNFVRSNRHAKILFSIEGYAATAFCHLHPSQNAPQDYVPPEGSIDIQHCYRPEALPLVPAVLDHRETFKRHFSELHGEFLVIDFLAVDPDRQGQGLGSRLLQLLLRRADEKRHWCYLEAMSLEGAAFYQRFGFITLAHPSWTSPGLTGCLELVYMGRPPGESTQL